MNDEIGYNIVNNVNDEWNGELAGQALSGKVVETVDKTTLENVSNPGCKHLRTVKRPADEFMEDVTEITCEDCPLGWFEATS